ncbi:hypothetical protein EV175_006052 [Coemansia sp. RSA 1933]|nr:hypothetical protein EV175_006052 [Coemansia sp. RSA 1933]
MLDSFESFLVADSGVEGAELNSDDSDGNEDLEGFDENVDLDASEIVDALMKAIGEMNQGPHSDTAHDSENKADNNSSQGTGMDTSIEAVIDSMDRELSESKVGQSFVRSARHENDIGGDDSEYGHDVYDIPDVDIDLNLVENIVQSFRAQEGLAGPAGTMLEQFGIHLPHAEDDNDDNNADDNAKP